MPLPEAVATVGGVVGKLSDTLVGGLMVVVVGGGDVVVEEVVVTSTVVVGSAVVVDEEELVDVGAVVVVPLEHAGVSPLSDATLMGELPE